MLSLTQLVAKARAVHGERYTYSGESKQGRYRFLHIVCKDHGEFKQVFGNHLQGKGCPACGKLENNKGVTHTLEDIRRIGATIHFDRYKYISLDRDSRYPYLTLSCSQHGEFKQGMYNHLAGEGCPDCRKARLPTKLRKPRQYVELSLTHGGPVLSEVMLSCFEDFVKKASEKYIGKYKYTELTRENSSVRRVGVTCPSHGYSTQSWESHLNTTHGCPVCAKTSQSVKVTRDLTRFTEEANLLHKGKYEYLAVDLGGGSASLGSNAAALIVCSEHGEFVQSKSDHLRGYGCAQCSSRKSKSANSLVEFVKTLTEVATEVSLNNSKLRWDIVLPDKKLAIEFHGLYWHSEAFRDKEYHATKHKLGLDAGYRTLHIFEDEWVSKRNVIESLIRSSLNLRGSKVFARNCKIVSVSGADATTFLNQYHVQGATSASKYVGLMEHESLVAILGYAFKESGRGKNRSNTSVEITRYATSKGVVGGFSKLLRKLISLNPGVCRVHTFSDIRLFSGMLYEKTGFKCVAKLPPSYFYVRFGRRVNKCNLQKSAFKKNSKLLYDPTLTERELAELNNFHRVYDCGKLKWELFL